METLEDLLKNVLIKDVIQIIYEYTKEDGIICHKCGLQVSLDSECIQCLWIISWEQPNNKYLKELS